MRCHPERSEGSAVALRTPKPANFPVADQPLATRNLDPFIPLPRVVILSAAKDLRLLFNSPYGRALAGNRQAQRHTSRGRDRLRQDSPTR